MRRLVEVISRWRRAVAAGLTVLIATMLIGAMRVRVDNSLNVWFVDDDPALLSWLSFLERFGDEEMVVTVVRGTTPALSAQRLAHLALLSAELATVDGVARVQSLATLQPPLIIAPVDSTDIAAVRAAVSHSRIAAGLVGEDGASLVVRTLLEANATSDMRRPQILDELFTVVDTSLDGRETAHHGGIGVLHDALNRATLEEGTRFVLGAYLVIIAVLLIILRSWLWVGLAIGVVAAADLCLFG
ncbi:MAG: MMPL family transporter, partial [Gemmatimonadetes bacterium]|nr:MMPL family transporter [Gemmatimonadota bacterium]